MKRHEYRVGIICALPKELAAVIAMLSESHIPLPQRPNDTNAYTLGRIGPHNVVVTCLPGRTGTTSAAGVAIQLKASFPSIRFGLLVGIAGGIPSEAHDIRLGDVVVSYPNGTSGGIIQYDFGKTERGGVFTRCGQVNRPPDELLSAVNSLFAKQLLHGGSGLAEQLSATAVKFPKMNSWWFYPGSQHDCLFKAHYEHSQSDGDCSECDTSQLIRRDVRQSHEPVVHFGTIASGNRVIKHGAERDRIGCDLRAMCFDMEAESHALSCKLKDTTSASSDIVRGRFANETHLSTFDVRCAVDFGIRSRQRLYVVGISGGRLTSACRIS